MAISDVSVKIEQMGQDGWFFAHSDDMTGLKLCSEDLLSLKSQAINAVRMLVPDASVSFQLDKIREALLTARA